MKTKTAPEAVQPPAQRPGQIYRRVLVGTDLSSTCEPALAHALKIARENRAELLVAHACVWPGNMSYLPHHSYDRWVAESRLTAEKQLRPFIERARQDGVHCHALILTGLPDDAILSVAQKLKVDLIVIGTHHHRGVSRFFVENVAARVMSHARCSVLTVRPAAARTRLN